MSSGPDDGEPKALVAAPAVEMKVARSLASARASEVVAIDRHGQSRSRLWFKSLDVVSHASLGVSSLYTLYLWNAGFGGPMMWGLTAIASWAWWVVLNAHTVRRGQALLVADRLDDAEIPLRRAVRTPLLGRSTRASAWLALSQIERQRGHREDALAACRAALREAPRFSRHVRMIAQYEEITLLVDLDRLPEAERLFYTRHPKVPRGDYLRLLHRTSEIYLHLALNRPVRDVAALHDDVRFALGMTTSRLILGLLAWAHHTAGDVEQAWHLLRESFEREVRMPLAAYPRLHAWVEAHRAEAMAAAAADEG